MKTIILILAIAISLFGSVSDDLKKRVQDKSDAVVSILKNKTLSKDEQNNQIDKNISDMFDYDLMAKLSIGKKSWQKMKESEQKEYTELFTEHIKNSYYEKTHLLSDEKVTVVDAKKVKSRVFVTANIKGIKDTIKLVYKFYHSKSGWLVYDMEISGISIIKSYRSQFKEIVQDENPIKLIEKLKSLKHS